MAPTARAAWLLIALLSAHAASRAEAQAIVTADALAVQRGAYAFAAAGCESCHTDSKAKGRLLAGGPAIVTPFGTFYAPNITPDPVYGIGQWSDADFARALRDGRGPDGKHYYPSFPYPAFTQMSDRDLADLKAYVFSLPAVARPSRPHELRFPFGFRIVNRLWKWLYFEPARFAPDPDLSDAINRGAYVVHALTHCGECHTPRSLLGGLDKSEWLAGTPKGPEGKSVPNITPHPTGIASWSADDITVFLEQGLTPEGDFVGGLMADVIEHSTSRLTREDRASIAAYLKSIPPIDNKIAR